MRSLISILIIFIGSSCQESRDVELEYISDLQDKFEISLPTKWHREYIQNEFSSGILSANTSLTIEDVLVLSIIWDSVCIYINQHFEKTIDSLNARVGLHTKSTKIDTINEYPAYYTHCYGFDSLNNSNMNVFSYYIKSDSANGHINFKAIIYKDSIKIDQSEFISKVLKTIKIISNKA